MSQFFKGSSNSSSEVLVQEVRTKTNTYLSGSSVLPGDNTVPTSASGTLLFSLDITPFSASNVLVFDVCLSAASNGSVGTEFFIVGPGSIAAIYSAQDSNASGAGITKLNFYAVAGSTSLSTYSFYFGPIGAGTTYINGNSGGPFGGGTVYSTFIIGEYTP